MFVFFFFTQKTAYEMRISDWSSDVCSSDLRAKICSGTRHASSAQTLADGATRARPDTSFQRRNSSHRPVTSTIGPCAPSSPVHDWRTTKIIVGMLKRRRPITSEIAPTRAFREKVPGCPAALLVSATAAIQFHNDLRKQRRSEERAVW